jgi:hypothetical protein
MNEFRLPATVLFSRFAAVALSDRVTDCEGASILGSRDDTGRPHVLCGFLPGESERALAEDLPLSAALVLLPADARALARELERAAEEAEEEQ